MSNIVRALSDARNAKKGQWITNVVRAALVLIFFGHFAGAFDLDGAVAGLWQWMYDRSWCHLAMMEAIVAAISFFAWIVHFRTLNEFAWVKQFRLVPHEDELENASILPRPVQDFYGAMTAKAPNHRQRRAARVFASLPVYLGAIFLLHLVKDARPLEQAPPTFLRLTGELAVGIWAYDFVFFWIHVAMHCCPARCHGHTIHHSFTEDASGKAKFLEPEAVVNHSLLDGILQVVCNILVQNIVLFGTPKHKLSRFLHNILVTYLLTESHAGLNLPWLSHRLCPQIFGGAVRHEVHHHTHKHCYQQFFMYLDDLLGLGPRAAIGKEAGGCSGDGGGAQVKAGSWQARRCQASDKE